MTTATPVPPAATPTSAPAQDLVAAAMADAARILLARRVVTMVVFAATTLVLVRVLSVESFGAYAGALAATQIAISATDLGFSSVLVRDLPRVVPEAAARLRQAVRLMSLWATLLAATLLGMGISRGLDSDAGLALAIFAPGLLIAGLGLYRVPFLLFHDVRTMARIDVLLSVGQAVAVIAATVIFQTVAAVAIAMTVTTVFTVLVVALRGRRLLRRHEMALPASTTRLGVVRAAVPLGVASLLSSLYFSIDLVLLGWIADADEVGVYAAGVKVLNVLVTVPAVIAPVILRGMSDAEGPRELGALLARAWHWMLVAIVPACAAIAVFPEPVIALLFGPEYEGGLHALRLLAVAGIGSALATLLAVLVIRLDRGRAQLVGCLGLLGFNVAANLALVPALGIDAAAAITLATEVLACAVAAALLRGRVQAGPALRVTVRPVLALAGATAIAVAAPVSDLARLTLTVLASWGLLALVGGWPAELRVSVRRRPRRGAAPPRS